MNGWPEDASAEMVDVVFELEAGTVAPDHADALASALRLALPWLDDEPHAGILPLSGLGRGDGLSYVGRRSRLVIRMPIHRSAGADSLCGRALDIDGEPLGIGRSSLRPLLPVTEVVHSHFVSFGTADEIEFLAACRAELAQRRIGGEPVTGRARRMHSAAGEVHGFALMLHGLKRAESVAIQETGLGRHHLLGCGLFVPHKSIAAVGE
ncbi:MAG: type I-MYXAN CRISPR-associated protein Cas6/Cmx6 [Sulfuritalea sp.]|nr:type I-MYXAN CRISPR-associated protein Cas6/Cmx6 [Sulfuritalea sp.]